MRETNVSLCYLSHNNLNPFVCEENQSCAQITQIQNSKTLGYNKLKTEKRNCKHESSGLWLAKNVFALTDFVSIVVV